MRKFLRVLFSRYALSAFFIIADIALLALMMFYAYSYYWVFAIFAAIVDFLVLISIINTDMNPEFKLTWVTVVLLIPVLGGAIYIIFSRSRLRPGEAKFMREISKSLKEHERICGIDELSLKNLDDLSEISKNAAGKAHALLHDDGFAEISRGNETTYYDTGEAIFADMLKELQKAKRFILLEYFIIEDGIMWKSILSILKNKASEGVCVRLLYDDIGCMGTLHASFSKEMHSCGIECFSFAKVTPKLASSHNNRDHRKICVVDGTVAFTGGINIADEYINEKKRFGHWKDGGIKVNGNSARGFVKLFLTLYDLTARTISDYDFFLPPISGEEVENKNSGFLIPFGSGPSLAYSAPVGKNVLMNIINTAERYIYITSPYLIIDYDLTEAFRSAAKRGVDVRIITPGIPDKKIIKIMTKSSYPYLLEGGVRIFEYTPGFIHEKTIVSDDIYAMVGTINLDYRSLVHHFEDGLWVFGDPVAGEIRDSFMKTQSASSEQLASECKLNFLQKTIRDLVRIFAPLL